MNNQKESNELFISGRCNLRLKSAIGMDYKELEIFCPCSENELESIVDFLYDGKIPDQTVNDIAN